ncbi:hypothetical protein SDC9_49866 [bioreactor metagenome]|uniref:Uncharacterized protein n=1 Tax=bioreactor metagenome TaxID=1076179 RepID=A0A644WJ15_9ZZZZ
MLIHCISAGDKGDDAARPHLVEGFCKKVIVNGKAELVVSPVIDLILPEGDVAHGDIVKVPPVGGFKACYGNVGIRVKLFCDFSGDAVQLHAVEP